MSEDMNIKEFKPNIEEVMERYKAYCRFEETDRPLLHVYAPTGMRPRGYGAPVSGPKRIELFERYFKARSAILDDWMPVVWARTPWLGRYFIKGRKRPKSRKMSGTTWGKPLLEDWREVDKLQVDFDSKRAKRSLERLEEITEGSKGRYAVSAGAFCPGDGASGLVGQGRNFIVGIYRYPDEFKALMKLCSETQMKTNEMFFERINHPFGGTVVPWLQNWMPGKRSAVCQEDCAVFLSPKMFSEWLKPYDEWGMSQLDFTTFHNDNAWQITHILQEMKCLGVLQLTDSGNATTGFKGTRAMELEVLRKENRKKPIIIYCINMEEIKYVMRNLGTRGLLIKIGAKSIEKANKLIKEVEALAQRL